jgi:hypothetical protein
MYELTKICVSTFSGILIFDWFYKVYSSISWTLRRLYHRLGNSTTHRAPEKSNVFNNLSKYSRK